MKRAAGWAAHAALHGGLAGALVGGAEAVRLAQGGGAPLVGLVLLGVGLGTLAGVMAGVPLLLVTDTVLRVPAMRSWRADLARPGAARVAAIARAVVALAAAVCFAVLAYRLAVFTHGRFNAPGAVGLLHAAALTALAVALVLGALAVAPALERSVARRDRAARYTTGRRGLVLLVLGTGGVLSLAARFLHQAAPAADFRPAATAIGFLAALAAGSAAGTARRLGRRGRLIAAAALVLAAAGALAAIGRMPAVRQRVAARGIATATVLRGLWALSDRDHDGSPSRFGGSDCDDDDPRVHPGAPEIAANGVDDNCAGGDVTAEMLAPRTRAVPSARARSAENVLLITMDAVRADHTSAYGYQRPTTPTLERLAARGTRFEWAISSSPTTRRAIPSLMTGRYASTLFFEESEKDWPPHLTRKAHHILGQSFKKAGYATHAVLCCTTLFDRTAGVIEGIDEVDASAAKIKKHAAEHIATRVEALLPELAAGGKPFFLWIHFLDPHNPYDQPDGVPSFGSSDIDRYDAEIRMVDDRIGRILAALEQTGLAARTVVAVSADHGDEFFEHGNQYHGRSLYTELERVPLVIAAPGMTARTVAAPVSLVDIGPTLLDLVGLERPAGQNGRSLAGAMAGEPPPDRMVLAELMADRNITRNLVAGFRGTWQVIWDLDANTHELYALDRDPGDRDDLSGAEPERLAALRAELERQIDAELTPLPSDRGRPKRPPSSHGARPSE
jgi:arylsulfatase A-like enzyme